MLFSAKSLLKIILAKVLITSVYLPYCVIQRNSVTSSVAQQCRISRAVLRVVYKQVSVQLKPVYILLFRQTHHIRLGCHHRKLLLIQVVSQSHVVIHHAVIAHTAQSHFRIASVIRDVVPHPYLVLRLQRTHVQARVVRRRYLLLSSNILYEQCRTY